MADLTTALRLAGYLDHQTALEHVVREFTAARAAAIAEQLRAASVLSLVAAQMPTPLEAAAQALTLCTVVHNFAITDPEEADV